MYQVLPIFARKILSLPTSNADAERIFSKINLNQTKFRNKRSLQTQANIVLTSETAHESGG